LKTATVSVWAKRGKQAEAIQKAPRVLKIHGLFRQNPMAFPPDVEGSLSFLGYSGKVPRKGKRHGEELSMVVKS
jgi:hypothetical protein